MGILAEGKWVDDDLSILLKDGRLQRPETKFRARITKDGSSGFPAEAGRYCLYVSYACPWAHRTLITRVLKHLEASISVIVVSPLMLKDGWTFDAYPCSTPDTINGFRYLHELYTASNPTYTGRVTVPVLWDTRTHQIVSNESSDIILMLNEAFDSLDTPDLYPPQFQADIDTINQEIYDKVNNGVYKAGFAMNQEAYEESVRPLFACLDWLEERLSTRRYLLGETFTVADIRLFVTLVRFDPVYLVHFKCSLRPIASYHHLSNYLREIYQLPGIAETVNFDHIRAHYYYSHLLINPFRLIPVGPVADLKGSHDRNRLAGGFFMRKEANSSSIEYILAATEAVFYSLLAVLSL